MILSQSDFTSKVADVSKAAGLDIASAFDLYKAGRSVDMKSLMAKNTKLKSVRNWYDTSVLFSIGNGTGALAYINNFSGYYDSQIGISISMINAAGAPQTYNISNSFIKPSYQITQIQISQTAIYYETATTPVYQPGDVVTITGPGTSFGFDISEAIGVKTVLAVYPNSFSVVHSSATNLAVSTNNTYSSHTVAYDSLMSSIEGLFDSLGYNSYQSITTGLSKTGLAATLTQGLKTVSLTTGDTSQLLPGNTIQYVSGAGAFGASATIASIESSSSFTVNVTHATSGNVTFNVTNVTNGTIVLRSSKTGACYYNYFTPVITITNNTPPTAFRTYTNPTLLSQLGFYGGVCSDLAGAFHESTALTGDQAEAMLNELRSSYNV